MVPRKFSSCLAFSTPSPLFHPPQGFYTKKIPFFLSTLSAILATRCVTRCKHNILFPLLKDIWQTFESNHFDLFSNLQFNFLFFFLMKITCNKLGSGCRNDAFILAWRDGPYSLPLALLHCPARCGWKGRTGLLPSCFSFGKKKPWIRVALSFRSCRRVGTVTLFQTWWLL